MDDVTKLLKRLTDSNARIARLDGDRETAMRERDAMLRSAKAAGATWADLEATGLSKATVAKALKR